MKHLISISLLFALFLNCIFETIPPKEPFTMNLLANDTSSVSVYENLVVAFSKQLPADSIPFHISPVFLSFYCTMNPTRDTATIVLYEDLDYGTQYTISVENSFRNSEGKPVENTISFGTVAGETEPNDAIATADTFVLDKAYGGNIFPRNDADWFLVEIPSTADSFSATLGHPIADLDLELWDSDSSTILSSSVILGNAPDSITIPVGFSGYFPIKVYSGGGKNVGGRYRFYAKAW